MTRSRVISRLNSSLFGQKLPSKIVNRYNCGVAFNGYFDPKERSNNILQQSFKHLKLLGHRGGNIGNQFDGVGIVTNAPNLLIQERLKSDYELNPERNNYLIATQILNPNSKTLSEDINKYILTKYKHYIDAIEVVEIPTDKKILPIDQQGNVPKYQNVIFKIREDVLLKNFEECKDDLLSFKAFKKSYNEKLAANIGLSINQFVTSKKVKIKDFDLCSIAQDSIIFKGMYNPDLLPSFFTYLSNQNYKVNWAATHNRMATNSKPFHPLAQPFWGVVHNGEFNSVRKSQTNLTNSGMHIPQNLSDSKIFSINVNALVSKGFKVSEALEVLIPQYRGFNQKLTGFIRQYQESYQGPAGIIFYGEGEVGFKADNSALRPLNFTKYKDENGVLKLYAGSEKLIDPNSNEIIESKSLRTGEMLVFRDSEGVYEQLGSELVKEDINKKFQQKFGTKYLEKFQDSTIAIADQPTSQKIFENNLGLLKLQILSSWNQETIDVIVKPMALNAKQKIFAMGNDTPQRDLEEYSDHLSGYFKQNFVQVTAPTQDSKKEIELYNSKVLLGAKFQSKISNNNSIEISSPIINNGQLLEIEKQKDLVASLDITFDIENSSIEEAMLDLLEQAKENINNGKEIIILSDRLVSLERASIPDLLVVNYIYNQLQKDPNLVNKFSIVVDSSQIKSPHDSSCLMAYGANAVNPYLAYETIKEIAKSELKDQGQLIENYQKAMLDSHFKTMAKLGLTDVNVYHGLGAGAMSIVGLNLTNHFLDNQFFFGGYKINDIEESIRKKHEIAKNNKFDFLPDIGNFAWRANQIRHGYDPYFIDEFSNFISKNRVDTLKNRDHILNKVEDCIKHDKPLDKEDVNNFIVSDGYNKFANIINEVNSQKPCSIIDSFDIKTSNKPIAIKDVESSNSDLISVMESGGMSLGALTSAAHESIAIAENLIGGSSNTGEGGESEINYTKFGKKLKNAKNKQVASGRFGVTPEYLANVYGNKLVSNDSFDLGFNQHSGGYIEIKISQGAKPGEGGQLPSVKVSAQYAAKRGSIPGIGLISPPPHHDIYSIEDLKQLVYDLHQSGNRVTVKLASSENIGSVALGVAKCGVEKIKIAGNSGGTGAASLSSIKNTGLSPEFALVEVDNILRENGLRDNVKLSISGGIKTGYDILKFSVLGADHFEMGTSEMIGLGCKMLRLCNIPGGCTPGIANLEKNFDNQDFSKVKDLVGYKLNIAAEIKELLAKFGFKSLEEIRGRRDLVNFNHNRRHFQDSMFTRNILANAIVPNIDYIVEEKSTINDKILNTLKEKQDEILNSETSKIILKEYNISNIDRTIGTPSSIYLSQILKREKSENMTFGNYPIISETQRFVDQDFIKIPFKGVAGQSFGFCNSHGLHLDLSGDAQDGVGKSCSGGVISVKGNVGNVLGYGASGGDIYIAGKASNRAGILAKGATIVVEGVGDFAVEYMTEGSFINLGKYGSYFGVGASGGIIVQYDPENLIDDKNYKISDDIRLSEKNQLYQNVIKKILENHLHYANSKKAQFILDNWDYEKNLFKVLIPRALDKIKTEFDISDVEEKYEYSKNPISPLMEVWLESKKKDLLLNKNNKKTGDIYKLSPNDYVSKENLIYDKTPTQKRVSEIVEDEKISTFSNEEEIHNIIKSKPIASIDSKKRFLEFSHFIEKAAGECGCNLQSCSNGCPLNKEISRINNNLKQISPYLDEINQYLIKQTQEEIEGRQIVNYSGLNEDLSKIIGNVNDLSIERIKEILKDSFDLQASLSPFFALTGKVCPAPCESACTNAVVNDGNGKAVKIRIITEDLLAEFGKRAGWFDKFFQLNKEKFTENGKKIIIVGSGPSAMQAAYDARKKGYQVTIYERNPIFGGVPQDGIPHHKLNKSWLRFYEQKMKDIGIKMIANTEVNKDFLEKEKADAVLLATGVTDNPNLPPNSENIINGMIPAMEFLQERNTHLELRKVGYESSPKLAYDPNIKIAVLGGGDTATDAIRNLIKMGYKQDQLIIIDRNLKKLSTRPIGNNWPRPKEVATREVDEELEFVNASQNYSCQPVEFIDDGNGNLKGIKIKHLKPVSSIDNHLAKNHRNMVIDTSKGKDGYEIIAVDKLIYAYGYKGPKGSFLFNELGIAEVVDNIAFDKDKKQIDNVFVSGDAANPGSQWLIVNSQESAKKAIEQIDKSLHNPRLLNTDLEMSPFR